jgi:beta-lactam-binding protein with PASTA domain
VPKLAGKSLGQAKSAISAAGCTVGKVTKPKKAKGKLVVKSSSPAAGSVVSAGTPVNIKLGPKPKAKKKHKRH